MARKVTCPRCGKEFGCGIDQKDCFCTKYTLTKPVLSKISTLYNDCLCEECLRLYAEKSSCD